MSDPTEELTSKLLFGTAPVNWNNFDLENWRPTVDFPAILDEMLEAGYVRTEWDASFGVDVAVLSDEIRKRGMRFIGAYRWVDFLDADQFQRDCDQLLSFFPTLHAVGISDLIVADTLRPIRVANAGAIPANGSLSLAADDYRTLAENIGKLADVAGEFGIRVRYHNHVGSWIETPSELTDLMAQMDFSKVDLCFDTGHYAFGGGDPYAFIADNIGTIGLLHLKDIDPAILIESRANGWSFREALQNIIFCPLGEGSARISDVVQVLVDSQFAGHIIIEQDTCAGDSTETAGLNLTRALTYETSAQSHRRSQ